VIAAFSGGMAPAISQVMPWSPAASRVVEPGQDQDLERVNQELARTQWEVGYSALKLAAAAGARPIVSLRTRSE
jgi:hypothetical protein